MAKKILAILPARGGSKRIPRKNIKEFCGKPILAYPIESAIKADIFDEIMVSTDDNEIASISKKYGAKVPFLRSQESSDDFSNLADVVNEVIAKYKEDGKEFDMVCVIMATTPFLKKQSLIDAHKLILENKADSVYPLVEFHYPILKSLKIENGYIERAFPDFSLMRSQDMQAFYHDAAQFYFFNLNNYTGKSFILDRTYPSVIAEKDTHDIDTIEDWEIAEFKYKYFKANNE